MFRTSVLLNIADLIPYKWDMIFLFLLYNIVFMFNYNLHFDCLQYSMMTYEIESQNRS